MQKKPMLGKGLADLLHRPVTQPPIGHQPAAATPNSTAEELATTEELAKLPLDILQRGTYQPRVDMRPETLQELANSIKAQGVVQPIVVRPVGVAGTGESQRYEIIAGERRWRAAQMAGLTQIPAIIRRIPDEAAIAVALIENIQRENLNSLEEARALDRLINEFQLTHQQCADAIGRSRVAVTNLLRLLELPPEVCERLERRELDMGHARALRGLPDSRQQTEVATVVARKSLSVRETEDLVRRRQQHVEANTPDAKHMALDPEVERLKQALAVTLETEVAIKQAADGHGKLTVSYDTPEKIKAILRLLLR